MLQGTGSDVGKSLLVAGLCRLFTRRGLTVRPFKPQNMSNNAAVTTDGGEIGRAQALQARACGAAPSVHMNPVLLKPQTETGAQVVVRGRVVGNASAREYHRLKPTLMPTILDSFAQLRSEADLVIVEGAGSAAEVNLREADVANMGFAEAADVPVVLVGDIDRGGVIASLVGVHALLSASERGRVKGYLINKFRGDPALFDPALAIIGKHTGLRSLGIVPWFRDAGRLPAEDGVVLEQRRDPGGGAIRIAVPRLPRISNFDDLDPLMAEPGVSVRFLDRGQAVPGDTDVVILPGSKATRSDLAALKAEGWDCDIRAHVRRGGLVVGICGGYQMLGRTVRDPDGVEGPPGESEGLGLLAVDTVLSGAKILREATAVDLASGEAVHGYEMHMGRTDGPDRDRPWLRLDGHPPTGEGARSPDGRVLGCYLHGLFAADGFRRAFLAGLGALGAETAYETRIEATLDALAAHLEAHIDVDALAALFG
ncbi:MAG: cobyric acid synthase [Alphaproteobacteria bacterium]|nr:cobyric acid synthase [Alphaproteobacteria bacterium]